MSKAIQNLLENPPTKTIPCTCALGSYCDFCKGMGSRDETDHEELEQQIRDAIDAEKKETK